MMVFSPGDPSYWFGVTYFPFIEEVGGGGVSGITSPPGYSAWLGAPVCGTMFAGDELVSYCNSPIAYQADPQWIAAIPHLDAWYDTPLGHQLLAASMHSAYWTSLLGWGYGTGESDYDFFSRVAGPYNVAGAQSWQQIAHRVGFIDGWLGSWTQGGGCGGSFVGQKGMLQQHYRAKVLSEFFAQPAVVAAYGRPNWPAAAGISDAVLANEIMIVSENLKQFAKDQADIGIMGYVTLAVLSFGIGLAVSVAVAAIVAEAAAAAAAEAIVGIEATAAVEIGATGLTEAAISVGEKIITQEIMSLATTGDLTSPNLVSVATTLAGGAIGDIVGAPTIDAAFDLPLDEFGDLSLLTADWLPVELSVPEFADLSGYEVADVEAASIAFPDVSLNDALTYAKTGYSLYQAFEQADSAPSAPRPATAAPAAVTTAPVVTPVRTSASTVIMPALVTDYLPTDYAAAFAPGEAVGEEVAISPQPVPNYLWLAIVAALNVWGAK